MSDEIHDAEDRLLQQWIRPALGTSVQVDFEGTGEAAGGGAGLQVRVHLLDLLSSPPPRGHEAPPLRLQARYVVTVAGPDAGSGGARAALAELAFAALASTTVELERATPSLEYWRALAVPPRPALIVRVPLQRAKPARKVPLVRQPLVTEWSDLHPLDGMVVTGPDNVAVAGALIELEGQGLATYSDHRGAFRFAAVPDEPPTKTLVVQAKGQRLAFQATRGPEPFVLSLPLPEP